MIYIESFILSLLVLIGAYCSVCDIRKGIIPNSVIIIGASGAIIGNIAYYIVAGVELLPTFLLHIVSAIVIAVLMYVLKIWAGGDVKLFSVLATLIPASYLKQIIPIPAIFIFSIVFSLAFIYLMVQSIVFLIRREKTYKKTSRFAPVPFISCIVFIMAIQAILRFALRETYVEYIGVFLFLNIILVLLFGKMKFLQNIISIIICSLICLAEIIYAVLSQKPVFDYRSLIIVLLVIFLRLIASRYNYQEIKTTDVKPGMVLSYGTILLFAQSRIKGIPQTTSEDMGSRISKEEAESILRWSQSKYGQDTIVIVRKFPFAVFIAAGYLVYVILGLLW